MFCQPVSLGNLREPLGMRLPRLLLDEVELLDVVWDEVELLDVLWDEVELLDVDVEGMVGGR